MFFNSIIVSIEGKVYINGFSDLKSIAFFSIATPYPNVLTMCYTNPTIAFPTEKKGHCQVYNIESSKIIADIKVSESHVACLGLNDDGTILASASEKGTLIRVFDLKDGGKQIREVRRGSDRAEIHSLVFDNTNDFLVCSSDKGTIHLFIVGESGDKVKSAVKSLGSYFKGERSFAKFRLTGIHPKCIISEDRKLIVITKEGAYYVVEVDWVKGGECMKLDKKPLIDEEEGKPK